MGQTFGLVLKVQDGLPASHVTLCGLDLKQQLLTLPSYQYGTWEAVMMAKVVEFHLQKMPRLSSQLSALAPIVGIWGVKQQMGSLSQTNKCCYLRVFFFFLPYQVWIVCLYSRGVFCKICLFEMQSYKRFGGGGGNRERVSFYPPVHSPNGPNNLGLDQAKAKGLELQQGLPYVWQGPKHRSYFLLPSQVH